MPYLTERELRLRETLTADILASNLTYKDVMSAINHVLCSLKDKGGNLLDGASIQEVAGTERVSRQYIL